MVILDSRAVEPRARGGWATRRSAVVLGGAAGLAVLGATVMWEVARPALPLPFELGAAARWPAAAPWLGRLPMAAAAVFGLLCIYLLMARTAGRRAGAYAVAVLATTPAWFVHGRIMTGAILPMACSAGVLAGLGVALLDARASRRMRLAAAAAAIAAAAASVLAARWGVANRGLVAVAAVPAAAVGLAALLWERAEERARGAARAWRGAGLLGIAAAIAAAGAAAALLDASSAAAALLLGPAARVSGESTFDAPVSALAYGLVPWTPLVPLALARRPNGAAHLAVMLATILSLAAHAALAPRSGPATLVGVSSVAAAVAALLHGLEETRRPATTLVVTVLAVGCLVAHDVAMSPARVLIAFGAQDAPMPAAQAGAVSLAVRSSLWMLTALASLALLAPRRWLPTGRGLAVVIAGVLAGLVLRVHAYPELLARLSPGAAFETWGRLHGAGEPLGLIGVDPRAAAFAPADSLVLHGEGRAAGAWLASPAPAPSMPSRRFLALAASELPPVNAAYRAVTGRNVPVIAGVEGATLLAVSSLASDQRNDNPLQAVVVAAAPEALRPMGARLEDRLDALGWELVDERGRRLEAIPRGSRHARVRVFVGVRAPSLGGHCTFLHVDHRPSRFSAEHREHPYPMSLWRTGDMVVDEFDVLLPAHFRPGTYPMFWGVGVLPCEDDRRMRVTSGPNDGRDRIPAGALEVR